MTTNVAAGYASDDARSHGDMKTTVEILVSLLKESPGGAAPLAVTLAGDAFTPANNSGVFSLSAETGSADNLANISPVNIPNGRIIYVMAAAGNTITLKENAGGTGKLRMAQGIDKAISGDMRVAFRYDSSTTTFVEDDRNMQAMFPAGALNAFTLWMTPSDGSVGQWVAGTLVKAHLDANKLMHKMIGWVAINERAIDGSDILTPASTDGATISVAANTGTSDNVKFIDYANCAEGTQLRFRAKSGHTITFQHNQSSPTGTQGVLLLEGSGNITITGNQILDVQLLNSQWIQVNSAGLSSGSGGGSVIAGTVQGRLSVISAQAEMSSNALARKYADALQSQASATLYWVPARGGCVATYDGSQFVLRTGVTQKSISVAAKTLGAKCMVWMRHSDNELELEDFISRTASNNPAAGTNVTINMANTTGFTVGDVVTVVSGTNCDKAVVVVVSAGASITVDHLEHSHTTPVVWTNTPTTDFTLVQGVPLKTGDTTRLLLGVIEIQKTAGQINMDTDCCGLSNYWNRRWWHMRAKQNSVYTWSTVGSWRRARNVDILGESRVDIVTACAEMNVVCDNVQQIGTSTAEGAFLTGVAINNRDALPTFGLGTRTIVPAGERAISHDTAKGVLPRGSSAIWRVENIDAMASGTATFDAPYTYGANLAVSVEY